jgi:hypothetical protein
MIGLVLTWTCEKSKEGKPYMFYLIVTALENRFKTKLPSLAFSPDMILVAEATSQLKVPFKISTSAACDRCRRCLMPTSLRHRVYLFSALDPGRNGAGDAPPAKQGNPCPIPAGPCEIPISIGVLNAGQPTARR